MNCGSCTLQPTGCPQIMTVTYFLILSTGWPALASQQPLLFWISIRVQNQPAGAVKKQITEALDNAALIGWWLFQVIFVLAKNGLRPPTTRETFTCFQIHGGRTHGLAALLAYNWPKPTVLGVPCPRLRFRLGDLQATSIPCRPQCRVGYRQSWRDPRDQSHQIPVRKQWHSRYRIRALA